MQWIQSVNTSILVFVSFSDFSCLFFFSPFFALAVGSLIFHKLLYAIRGTEYGKSFSLTTQLYMVPQ